MGSKFRQVGEYGCDILDATSPQTGDWFAISFLSDTVFSALTSNATIEGSIGDFTFPKGLTFYAQVTGFTLASGAVVCYNDPA